MAGDLKDKIETNAQAPRRMRGNEGEVEQHALPDQIEADRYVKAEDSMANATAVYVSAGIDPP